MDEHNEVGAHETRTAMNDERVVLRRESRVRDLKIVRIVILHATPPLSYAGAPARTTRSVSTGRQLAF
jgi:hypothetical protein